MLLADALQHKGVRLVAMGWSSFIAENVIVTHNRDTLISWLGDEKTYTTCYGAMSTACLAGTGAAYLLHGRRAGPAMFVGSLPPGRAGAAFMLQSLGFVGLSQLLPPLGSRASAAAEAPPAAAPPAAAAADPQAAASIGSSSSSSGGSSGCPVPRWLRGGRPMPEGHPPTSSTATSSTAQPSAQAKEPQELSAGSFTSPSNAAAASGCPVPRWLRGGRPMPEGHPPTSGATASTAEALPPASADPPSQPQSSASGCPMPRWLRFGFGRDASPSEALPVAAPAPVQPPVEELPVKEDLAHGVERVTRHVAFWSLGFAGLGSALAARHAGCVALLSGPAAVAAIGGAHQDHRYRSSGKLSPERDAATSGVPFLALFDGRQSWRELVKELDSTNAAVALAFSVVLAVRRGLF